jgi:hypothetical protein
MISVVVTRKILAQEHGPNYERKDCAEGKNEKDLATPLFAGS